MIKKRITVLFLLFALTLTTVLTSCGSDTDNTTDHTTTNQTTAAVPGTTEDPADDDTMFRQIHDSLPEKMNFGEETVKLVMRDDPRYYSELKVDGTEVEVVSDAIYLRNLRVEERLNVAIDITTVKNIGATVGHGPWQEISTAIASGDYTYDIAIGSAAPATGFALKGQYKNIRNIDNIDLGKEYWSQGMLENMTLSDATYFVTGSISTYFYDSAYVIYFNRDLCDSYSIKPDYLYETVRNGDWTLDELLRLTENIYEDTNRNAVKDDGDTYGLGLQVTSATDGFWSSCDIQATEITDDGNVRFSVDLDKLSSVVGKLKKSLWSSSGAVALCEGPSYATDNIYYLDQQFANNEILFVTDWLYSVSTVNMRDMKSPYGILPYPKYDSEQESYKTYIHDKMSVVGVPMSVPEDRIEMVGAFLEAMSSGGQNIVMPAYYEKALTARYARDPESVETLDIIIRNVYNDRIWFLYSNVNTHLLRNQVWYNRSDLTAVYQSKYAVTNDYLSQMLEAYELYKDN